MKETVPGPLSSGRGRRLRSALVAVFLREIHEWRWVLAAAPLLGLLSWLAPYLPSLRNQSPEEVRTASILLCLGLFGGGFALALGSSLLVRDLAERRLGFYLARPVPAGALWLGKLAAAVVLLATALAGIALPGWLASGPSVPEIPGRSNDTALLVTAPEHNFAYGFASSMMPKALPPIALAGFAILLLLLAVLTVHAG
ncbi:MAG: hypothetical protein MI919_17105, partial [Holophagales bacterium]|nr:hypothetical protein [Holophagales bacterium]